MCHAGNRWFGPGFPEVIYQCSLAMELKKAGLHFQQEVEKKIIYDDQVIGQRRPDLVVAEKVLVEMKAIQD
jgi:GxxExxY protein